jgi:hypothetical protein
MSSNRIILMDMDETIGSFQDINLIYRCVERYMSLNELLNIFKKEVFRPCIFDIFKMIVNLKSINEVDKVILYTNNNGGHEWPSKIVKYIHGIIPGVFDDIIYGLFVSSGNIPDVRRKYYHKHIEEIRRILPVRDDTSFLFFDDVDHPYMYANDVEYILLNPYTRNISSGMVFEKLKYHPLFRFLRDALHEYETCSCNIFDEEDDIHHSESVRMIRTIIEFVNLNP